MDYAELFDKILKEKNLSDRKAAKKTKEAGYEVAASYINQIRNRKSDPPSDGVSKVIARICDKPEDLLVFQKYYENAPEAFRDTIENIRGTLVYVLIMLTASSVNVKRIEIIENELKQLSIAELIAECSTVNMDAVHQALKVVPQSDMLNANQDGYTVQDDAMSPMISKEATVYTWAYEDWTEYKDGDIFCYHKLGDEAFYVREVQFLNDEHTEFRMLPRNSSYPKETFTKEDIFLYGKVTGMFVEFN